MSLKLLVVSVVFATATCGAPSTTPAQSGRLEHGAVNPAVTQANIDQTICMVGWTKTIRPSSSYTNKIKTKMIAEQDWKGKAILDHYIPLQGGGAPSDPKNFILQTPKASYEKDNSEDQMNEDVCSGKVTLAEAQRAMGKDWRKYEENVR